MGYALGYRKILSARKNHRCFSCVDTILRGTSYNRWIYIDGGDFFEVKNHVGCSCIWSEEITSNDDEFSPNWMVNTLANWSWGEVYEVIKDCNQEEIARIKLLWDRINVL